MLFLLVMDCLLRSATDNSNCGIPRVNGGRFTDLDFADDIALRDNTWTGMARLTSRIKTEAGAVGLRINAKKTKLMAVGHMGDSQNRPSQLEASKWSQ
jgi:hypothetical protein